jgi:hypothetical protein
MNPVIFQVTPPMLHKDWVYIQPELVRLANKTQQEEWIPEDIYADIRSGRSFCYTVSFADEPMGFFILQPQGPRLLLHIVCMLRSAPREFRRRVMNEGICYIRQLAIQGGYKTVTAFSRRIGALRYFEKFGFHQKEIQFEMKI